MAATEHRRPPRDLAGEMVQWLAAANKPGRPGLRLYENDSPLAQARTHGPATEFAINTWYTIDLQVEGDQAIGRLCDDYNSRKLLEQVEVKLPSIEDRRYAGLIARDKGERADWFQSGVRQPVGSRR